MNHDFEKEIRDIETRLAELRKLNENPDVQFDTEIAELESELEDKRKEVYTELTPWQTVQIARHANRPGIRDYIKGMFSEFIELHGDRCFGDDQGIVGGFGTFRESKQKVMLIGHQKGKSVEENLKSNFGMASPDGYRKALRLMHLAEKYRLPVVSLIDTPGAYPGADAEARGQAEAIARNLTEMFSIETPIVVVVTGEGGSGGAIGIGVGDAVLMLSNSIYSVISPEGCASILWRDGSKAPDAAAALKLTASSLLELGVIDEIIDEPLGGAHGDHEATFQSVRSSLLKQLSKLKKTSTRRLLEKRFEKFAAMGNPEKGKK
jgi:acetyl-CoA carboxylase carboxyl transferase subunit alpha